MGEIRLSECKVGDQITTDGMSARFLGSFLTKRERRYVLGRADTGGAYDSIADIARGFPPDDTEEGVAAFAGYASYHVWCDEKVTVVKTATQAVKETAMRLSDCKVGDLITSGGIVARFLGSFVHNGSRTYVLGRTDDGGAYKSIQEVAKQFEPDDAIALDAFSGYTSYHAWGNEEVIVIQPATTPKEATTVAECKVGDQVDVNGGRAYVLGSFVADIGRLYVLGRTDTLGGYDSIGYITRCFRTTDGTDISGFSGWTSYHVWFGSASIKLVQPAKQEVKEVKGTTMKLSECSLGDRVIAVAADGTNSAGIIAAILNGSVVLARKKGDAPASDKEAWWLIATAARCKTYGVKYGEYEYLSSWSGGMGCSMVARAGKAEPKPAEETQADPNAYKKTTTLKVGDRIENAGRTGTIVAFGTYRGGSSEGDVVVMVKYEYGRRYDIPIDAKNRKEWGIDYTPENTSEKFEYWWAYNSKLLAPAATFPTVAEPAQSEEKVELEPETTKGTSIAGVLGLLATGVAMSLLAKGMKPKQTEVVRVNAPEEQNDATVEAEQADKEMAR